MPAIRFSASPPPRPPESPSGVSSPGAMPAQPVRSALARPEPSLEATFGLIFQAHERRYGEQDAYPSRSAGDPSSRHSETEVAALKRHRSIPQRPPRPTSAALQGAQAYLDATVKPATMRLKDVEAWVEDSLHAQTFYGLAPPAPLAPLDIPAADAHRCSAQSSSSDWPALEEVLATQEARTMPEGKSLPRMKSSSFSSSFGKKLRRSPSDLMNWLRTPPTQSLASRSRSISQATESYEGEQAVSSDRRWSSSSRRMLRLSDGSQRALPSPNSPSYRTVFSGLHRRFYSNDVTDSESSWSSFGCVDGMRRPDGGMEAEHIAKDKLDDDEEQCEGRANPVKRPSIVSEGSTASIASPIEGSGLEEFGEGSSLLRPSTTTEGNSTAGENKPVKRTLRRIASRLEVSVRQTRPYVESDTASRVPP